MSRKDRDEYIDLYRDSGWEYVSSLGSWHYFRAPADTARLRPAYSDRSSQRAKLLRVLAVLLLSILPMAFFGIVNPILNGYLAESRICWAITGFSALFILVAVYAAIRIALRITRIGRS